MTILDRFKDLYAFQGIIGLDISLDDPITYKGIRIQKKNNAITIQDYNDFLSIEKVKEYTSKYKNNSVSLLLSGKGVLVKSVLTTDKYFLSEDEIRLSFPSYSKEQYYVSQFKGIQRIWLAIVKRQLLDNLLIKLEENAIKPIQVFIGPFLFSNILKQLNVYSQVYVFSKHYIEIDNKGNWLDYSFSSEHINKFNLKVGDRLIKQEYLPAYATAFSTLMHDYVDHISLELPKTTFLFEEAKAKIKFKTNGVILLAVMFVLLLINMLLFNHLYQNNQQLQSNLSTQNVSDKQYEEISKLTIEYESLLNVLGWNGGISKAVLLEQIGLSLQNFPNITLTKIVVNPQIESKKGQLLDETGNHRKTIRLSGRAHSLESLNSWVKSLNRQEWIKTVHISKFGKSEGYDEKDYLFNLDIIFNHEL